MGRGMQRLCMALIAACLSTGCTSPTPTPVAVECPTLPDARETLASAWQAYQPDQNMPFSIPVRSHLFALQVLLISAGTYGESPQDPLTVDAQYASQFVRDFGMSRNPGLKAAVANLTQTLEQAHSEGDLGNNCGLLLARRMLRDDAVNVSADWVLQTITWGFAPTFQESIKRVVLEAAKACSAEPDGAATSEAVLECTMQKVGL